MLKKKHGDLRVLCVADVEARLAKQSRLLVAQNAYN